MPPKASKPTQAKRLADEAVNNDEAGGRVNILNRLLKREPVAEPSETMGTHSTLSTQSTESTHSAGVAPVRDFMKVANSIHREAVPSGIFKGKCKQLYDFLYSKTRGAIVPTRSVRLTRRQIMQGSGIGSTKTLFLNMRHLRESGLVTWDERVGPHEGNNYTVFLPEEVTMGTQSTLSTESASSPKVHRVLSVESTQSTHSLNVDLKDTSTKPKTFIKDYRENDDDEALAAFNAVLVKAVTEITGKPPAAAEADRWRELADVLATELKIASGRTSVSSVPSFFAEHLRRRLFKKDRAQLAREEKSAPEPTPKVEASQCPDCFGTGMWYPEGYEKGVAKCRHEKLQKPES